jgi:hypothetical protein
VQFHQPRLESASSSSGKEATDFTQQGGIDEQERKKRKRKKNKREK